MPLLLNISQPEEWPDALKAALDNVRPVMRAWELDLPARSAGDFERAVTELGNALLPYSILGWHCTRLTDDEVADVETAGLTPLSTGLIERRIAAQIERGTLPASVGDILRATQQGAASNRASMIWFCFFQPQEAGEGGIHRLLRHWGGEAMYWAHETDTTVANVLRQLGAPCIVEAEVPVAWLENTFPPLVVSIARRDLVHHGELIDEPMRFEGYSKCPIPGDLIRAVHRFPSEVFSFLSGCDHWREPL